MTFNYQIIDLSHPLDSSIPSWDMNCGFLQTIQSDYADGAGDTRFRVMQIQMPAGIGTHMDAPSHCYENAKSIDDFDLNELCLPTVVIDVSDEAHDNYLLSVDRIKAFEKIHGDILRDTCVMIRTGWEKHWHDAKRYHNQHVFPAISEEAAAYLLTKNIAALGIDTLSPDRPDLGYPVHRLLLGAGKCLLENVAQLEKLPSIGAYVLIAPLKIRRGTEAPLRLFGLVAR